MNKFKEKFTLYSNININKNVDNKLNEEVILSTYIRINIKSVIKSIIILLKKHLL